MKALQVLLLLLAVAVGSPAARAKDHAITLYGAYRDGGSFVDANTGKSLNIEGSGAGAIALDLPYDGARQLQLFVSRQKTRLSLQEAAAPPSLGTSVPLTVTYLHFGGTYFFEGPIGHGPYAMGGLGVTLFQLDVSGYEDELRPSLNVGFGYQFLLGQSVALRLEARAYGTLVESSGGLFCSGGCVISIKGDTVTQGEALLGLSFPF